MTEFCLEELKRLRLKEALIARESTINAGFVFNGWTFDSDERARANISGVGTLALAQGGMPDDFTWRDADNVDRPMSGMSVLALGAALFTHIVTAYYTYRARKDFIESCNDLNELLAYEIS